MPQPSIAVPNFSGTSTTVFTINPNGQATSANSQPVTLASDQVGTAGTPAAQVISVQGVTGGQPVITSLPSNAAQESGGNLAALNTTTGTSADTAWTGTGSSTVIAALKAIYNALVAALPAGTNVIGSILNISGTISLPTGASTSANQTTTNSTLATISTNTGNIPAKGAAVTASSTPVNIASDQTVPVSAASLPLPSGASTSALQTSGNTSLTNIASASGSTSDTAYAGSGAASIIAAIKGVYNACVASTPAGSNIIGKVGIDQTTLGTTNNVTLSDTSSNTATINTTTADGMAVALNRLRCSATLGGYNGTTWDMVRAGISAVTSTFTGFLNVLNYGVYNSTPLTLTNGQGSPIQVDASGNVQVATFSTIASVSPTITASAYTAGQVLGGLQTFTGCLRTPKNTGILNSITANFSSSIFSQGITVFLFSANPSGSTFTDKAAPAIAVADAGKLIGVVSMPSNYTSALGANHTMYYQTGIQMGLTGTAGTIYAVVIAIGAVTPTATTQFVNLQLGILQD